MWRSLLKERSPLHQNMHPLASSHEFFKIFVSQSSKPCLVVLMFWKFPPSKAQIHLAFLGIQIPDCCSSRLSAIPSDPGVSAWGRLEDLGASGRGFGGRFKVLVLFMFGEKKWPLALMNYEIWYTFNFTSAPNNMKTVLHKTCITIHAKIRST